MYIIVIIFSIIPQTTIIPRFSSLFLEINNSITVDCDVEIIQNIDKYMPTKMVRNVMMSEELIPSPQFKLDIQLLNVLNTIDIFIMSALFRIIAINEMTAIIISI